MRTQLNNVLRSTMAFSINRRQTRVPTPVASGYVVITFLCFGSLGPSDAGRAARASEPSGSPAPAQVAGSKTAGTPVAATDGTALATVVAQLDSPSFDARNKATDAILAHGKAAIPYLVEAIGAHSRETRFRAAELLRHCYTFEDVAPLLIADVRRRNDALARSILLERAVRQVNTITGLASAEKLFGFWGTSLGTYRREILNQLAEANTGADIAKVVTPLLDVKKKATRFEKMAGRITTLGLSYKSQYSATYVVARVMARGLLEGDPSMVDFAEKYVAAFESLARTLQHAGRRNSTLRKELADRAVYSQGAAAFLVKTLPPKSPGSALLVQTLRINPGQLRREFLLGLAEPDSKECYRRIGKTHIADMLAETVRDRADMLDQPVIARLVDAIRRTVQSGDKPKALALLDALDACKDLAKHGLSIRQGFGQQLAQRLANGALRAADNRAYHPTRAFHNRIVALYDAGVDDRNAAFPTKLIAAYLDGADQVITDQQRQAFERYVRIVTLLNTAHVPLDEPKVRAFILVMRDHLLSDHSVVRDGLMEVMRLTSASRQRVVPRADSVIAGIAKWAAKAEQ